ncbi:unnamed protein product [Effrenium voratum]|nr:unnamed protein product [Effrenium voratum]
MRQESRKLWITESIVFRGKLKKARRLRVREIQANQTQILSAVEGCSCLERWSFFLWKRLRPKHLAFTGCAEDTDGLSTNLGVNMTGSPYDGVCQVQQDKHSVLNCEQKYAACDPKAERVKPKFMIYRSTDILRADPVRLPLLQMDLHLHVDFRNRRADFCTPNFAPIMLDTNWHWSTFNWLPFDLRRSVCFGARIHPPGVSVQVTRCSHSGFGTMKKQTHSVEWSFTGVAYLISHYNTWGTGDGDMTQSWFGGSQNWGQKAK